MMITILIKLMLLIGEVVIGSFVQTVLSHSIQGCGIIYGPSFLSSREWLKRYPQMRSARDLNCFALADSVDVRKVICWSY